MSVASKPPCLTKMIDEATAAATTAALDKAAAETSELHAKHLAEVVAKLDVAVVAYEAARAARGGDLADIDVRISALERNLKCHLTQTCTDALDAARTKYLSDLVTAIDIKTKAEEALAAADCVAPCRKERAGTDIIRILIEEALNEGTALPARIDKLKAEVTRIEAVVCDATGDHVRAYIDFLEAKNERAEIWNGVDGTNPNPSEALCSRVTLLNTDLEAKSLELKKCEDGLAKLKSDRDAAAKAYEDLKNDRVTRLIKETVVPCAMPPTPAANPAAGATPAPSAV